MKKSELKKLVFEAICNFYQNSYRKALEEGKESDMVFSEGEVLPDNMDIMLSKFPTLKHALSRLMTDQFSEFVSGIDWISPKPTQFRINLKNGQNFTMKWAGKDFEATILGKRYYIGQLIGFQQALNKLAILYQEGPMGEEEEEQPSENNFPEPESKFSGDSGGNFPGTSEPSPEPASGETPPESEEPEGEDMGNKEIDFEADETISEAQLSIKDLSKSFNFKNNPEKAGQLRVTTFLEKIEKHDGFVIEGESGKWYVNTEDSHSISFIKKLEEIAEGNTSVTISKGVKVLIVADSKYIESEFEDIPEDCRKYVSLNHFTKTAEFGSTGQTTLGTTADVENLTGFFCAMRAVSEEPLSIELLKQDLDELGSKANFSASGVDNKSLVKKVAEILLNGNRWLNTFIKTANKLSSRGYLNSGMEIHRNDGFTKSIYSLFRKLEGSSRYSNVNKWTPADIWIASPELSIPAVGTLEEFNMFLTDALKNKLLVGVSLKSLGSGEAKVKEFNVDRKNLDTSHRVSKDDIQSAEWLLTGVTGNTLKVGKYKIIFRCTSVADSIATGFMAEVMELSAAARDGKAGLPAINYELKKFGKQLPTTKALSDLLQSRNSHVSGAKISKTMADMFMKIYIDCDTDDQRLVIINGILDYALSKTSDSAPFIKVS